MRCHTVSQGVSKVSLKICKETRNNLFRNSVELLREKIIVLCFKGLVVVSIIPVILQSAHFDLTIARCLD